MFTLTHMLQEREKAKTEEDKVEPSADNQASASIPIITTDETPGVEPKLSPGVTAEEGNSNGAGGDAHVTIL